MTELWFTINGIKGRGPLGVVLRFFQEPKPSLDMSASEDVTQLLVQWDGGDRAAFDRLLPIIYNDLRSIAHNQLVREREGHTLSTQGLVHESYLNLVDAAQVGWRNRGHFFAVASRAMRQVLIDRARKRKAEKRGGGVQAVTLDDHASPESIEIDELLALNNALDNLERHDERLARVVECRFFAGLTAEETAEALDVSARTVERDWSRARAYLKVELGE